MRERAKGRFMESPLSRWRMQRDHEPSQPECARPRAQPRSPIRPAPHFPTGWVTAEPAAPGDGRTPVAGACLAQGRFMESGHVPRTCSEPMNRDGALAGAPAFWSAAAPCRFRTHGCPSKAPEDSAPYTPLEYPMALWPACDPFPLTPALSLGEREDHSARDRNHGRLELATRRRGCSLSLRERVRVRGKSPSDRTDRPRATRFMESPPCAFAHASGP